ncbi:MAG: ABC transporter substrate-binding protein, partial [Bdellovibrio sp.]
YWPGWHEPGTTIECLINKKAFDSLPKRLQRIVEVACQSANEDMLSEFTARNAVALKTLVSKHKVKIRRFPDSVLKKLGSLSLQVLEETAAQNPQAKKVYSSFLNFKKQSMSWGKISEEGYALARALTEK